MTSDTQTDWLEARLQFAANTLPYPTTPDLVSAVGRRLRVARGRPSPVRTRLAWALVVVLVAAATVASVPEVRAGLLEFLQLGAVRIRLIEPTPTATSFPLPAGIGTPRPPTAAPSPSPTPLSSILDLAGRTTLQGAQARAGFEILLPSYPEDLGPPDEVFLQNLGGPLVVLVWLDSQEPGRVEFSLHQFGSGSAAAEKSAPEVILQTSVNGREALWTEGPHMLQMANGDHRLVRLVEGNVLIWVEGEITYRLETDLPLDEAVRIAESLR